MGLVPLLLISSAAFGALILFRTWRLDHLERERWSHLAWAVVLGGLGMVGAFAASWWLLEQFGLIERGGAVWARAWRAGALAAGCETAARLAVLLVIWWRLRGAINEPIDGIVFGVASGVGAALVEVAIEHVLENKSVWGREPWVVALFRNIGHTVLGGIACAGFGWVASRRRHGWALAAAGLAVSWVLHAVFDAIAMALEDLKVQDVPAGLGVLGGSIIFLGAVILSRWIRAAQKSGGVV